jgi:hypothetical protein
MTFPDTHAEPQVATRRAPRVYGPDTVIARPPLRDPASTYREEPPFADWRMAETPTWESAVSQSPPPVPPPIPHVPPLPPMPPAMAMPPPGGFGPAVGHKRRAKGRVLLVSVVVLLLVAGSGGAVYWAERTGRLPRSVASGAISQDAAARGAPTSAPAASLGTPSSGTAASSGSARDRGWHFAVLGTASPSEIYAEGFGLSSGDSATPKAGYHFVAVDVEVRDNLSANTVVDSQQFPLVDSEGRVVLPDAVGDTKSSLGADSLSLGSGCIGCTSTQTHYDDSPVDLRLVYTVPTDASGFTIGFRGFPPVPLKVGN